MTVGQMTQEVTVTGNIPKVQTETAVVSSVITNTQIQNLDLNGRNWVTLALLVPGAAPDNGLDAIHVGVAGNNSISFNGNRLQYANWEIDGGNNTDEGSASTFNTYPNLDTIAEFRISTSNYGAEMGKHAGANIELATKGGTKDFHGDLFEYARNDKFDSADFFTNRVSAAKSPLKWNDWAYTFGGPIYIPGHFNSSKSRLFFYWSEDWRRYRVGQVIGGSSNVPTTLERTGDFSECDPTSSNYNSTVASSCNVPIVNGVKYDKVTDVPGADAQSYTNATDILNALWPLPNNGPAGHLNGWLTSSSAPTNWRQEQIRIDSNITDKTQAFFRYTQDTWNTLSVPALWEWASYDTIKTPFGGPGESAVFHVTHTFTPTLTNEFVAAYTTDHILLYNQAADSVAMSLARPSNFVMSHLFAGNASNTLMTDVALCGGNQFCTWEGAGNHPWFNSNPIITWKDNVAWVHGNHTTKFGFYLENYRKNEMFGTDVQGDLQEWGGTPGTGVTTGNALADLFLGRISQYTEGSQLVNGVAVGGYPKGHWQMTDLEPYIQDDWKVSPRFTLNLGVRYYIYTRIHDVSRPTIDSGFIPSQYSTAAEDPLNSGESFLYPAIGATPGNYGNGLVECGHNGIPNGCQLRNTGKNFAPRLGFAWDPWGKGKTSIRGGYGIYYESGNGNEAQTEGGEGNPPSDAGVSVYNLYSTAPGAGYGVIAPSGLLVPSPPTYIPIPYSQPWPSVQQYNLTVEHEFPGNNLLSVAYVGALGRHLARNRNINQVDPAVVGNGATVSVPVLAGLTGTVAANPAYGVPGDKGQALCPAGSCAAQTILIYNEKGSGGFLFFVPYEGYNTMEGKENTAVSTYSALQASFRHTFTHGLTLQAAYTWEHMIDDSTSTYSETSGALNDYNLSRWKSTGDINRTQVLQLNYVYAIPAFKNSPNAFLRQSLGGWQISGITSFFTGEPTDFNCGVTGFSSGLGGAVRCDVVGKVAIKKGTWNDPTFGPTPTWWDPSTVAQPLFSELLANGEANMFGNMGRNILTGPGRNNFDMALEKNISTPWFKGEHGTLQFRLETFNTFNHPQWMGVNNGCSGSNMFGVTCNNNTTTPGEVNSDWGPRNMQLGLKFIF
jgi:hypothetical protein